MLDFEKSYAIRQKMEEGREDKSLGRDGPLQDSFGADDEAGCRRWSEGQAQESVKIYD